VTTRTAQRTCRRSAQIAFLLGLASVLGPRAATGQIYETSKVFAGQTPTDSHTGYFAARDAWIANTAAFEFVSFNNGVNGPYSSPTDPSSFTIDFSPSITNPALKSTMFLSNVDPNTPPPDSKGPWTFGLTNDHPDQFLGFSVNSPTGEFVRFVPSLKTPEATLTLKLPTDKSVTALTFAITGLGGQIPETMHVRFTPTGGAVQDYVVSGDPRGGLVFFGLANLPKTNNQFTIVLDNIFPGTRDIIGIDDIHFSTIVPEPGAGVLLAGGLALTVAARLFRRRRLRGR
jgi:hypothetical protein